MNDNVFSLLASIVLQHVTGRHRPRGEAAMGGKRVLYVFPKQSRAQAKESFMFKLLRVIFDGEVGQGDCFPSLPGYAVVMVSVCVAGAACQQSLPRRPFLCGERYPTLLLCC